MSAAGVGQRRRTGSGHFHSDERLVERRGEEWSREGRGGEEWRGDSSALFHVSITHIFFPLAELLQRITASASPSVLRRSLKTFCLLDTKPSEGRLEANRETTGGRQRPSKSHVGEQCGQPG